MLVFICGSRSVKQLPSAAVESLTKMMALGADIIVGDCYGVDALVQQWFADHDYFNVTVYHIGQSPRYCQHTNFKSERASGTRQTDKDDLMMIAADFGLAIWDGKSAGTQRSIEFMGNRMKTVHG